MALKDIVIPKETITFKGGSFEVHGITDYVITRLLVEGHRAEVERALSTFEGILHPESMEAQTHDLTGAFATLIMEMPDIVSKVIAYCADEPDAVQTVRELSLPVKLEAVVAICNLTFDGEDSIKKFVASLINLMIMTRKAAKPAVQGATEALAGGKS